VPGPAIKVTRTSIIRNQIAAGAMHALRCDVSVTSYCCFVMSNEVCTMTIDLVDRENLTIRQIV